MEGCNKKKKERVSIYLININLLCENPTNGFFQAENLQNWDKRPEYFSIKKKKKKKLKIIRLPSAKYKRNILISKIRIILFCFNKK